MQVGRDEFVETDHLTQDEIQRHISRLLPLAKSRSYPSGPSRAVEALHRAHQERHRYSDKELDQRIRFMRSELSSRSSHMHYEMHLRRSLQPLEIEKTRRQMEAFEALQKNFPVRSKRKHQSHDEPAKKRPIGPKKQAYLTKRLKLAKKGPKILLDPKVEKPSYGKGTQLHLGGVSGTHRSRIPRASRRRSRKSSKGTLSAGPTLTVLEPFHRQYGVDGYKKVKAKTAKKLKSGKNKPLSEKERVNIFDPQWRQKGTGYRKKQGKTGQDETLSTSSARKIIESLEPSTKSDELDKLIAMLSEHRSETSQLVWPVPDPKDPIGGHPGSLSKKQSDMRAGLTTLHNTKDTDRARLAMHQYRETLKKKNAKSAVEDAVLIARLESQKSFRAPYQELSKIDFSKSQDDRANVFTARYGQIVKDRKKTPKFERLARELHNSREREKWDLALHLLKKGHKHLVDPIYEEHLRKSQGDIGLAMKTFLATNPGPAPPISMSSHLPKASKNESLLSLDQLSGHYGQNPSLRRPMSPPRRPVAPPLKDPKKPKPKRTAEQETLDSFFE
ncbi:MAG: hypothetical protein AAGM22_30435 [Acidobacteriota bacterium]